MLAHYHSTNALSLNPNQPNTELLSRRDAILYGTGATLGAITGVAYINKDTRPKEHEQRVFRTFGKAIAQSDKLSSSSLLLASPNDTRNTFRILELGIGSNWQTLQRGLYDMDVLNDIGKNKDVSITGVDLLEVPNKTLQKLQQSNNIKLNTIQGDVSNLPFQNSYFDVITCCFTLCSVQNQITALQELKRVLKPQGTFGFMEHVAVNKQDNHEWLESQQVFFDPLQQKLADNCHLHRDTDVVILDMFGNVVEYEKFFVGSMWPVSCQSCGVVVNA